MKNGTLTANEVAQAVECGREIMAANGAPVGNINAAGHHNGIPSKFGELKVGDTFHTGIAKGAGYLQHETHVDFHEKISPSQSKIVKSDWAPRQVGNTRDMNHNYRVFKMPIPSHDTRGGLHL